MNGALINITTQNASINEYKNTINYRLQTSNRNTFSTPLENNKILLFMTSMFLVTIHDGSLPPNPITFRVNAAVES